MQERVKDQIELSGAGFDAAIWPSLVLLQRRVTCIAASRPESQGAYVQARQTPATALDHFGCCFSNK